MFNYAWFMMGVMLFEVAIALFIVMIGCC